MSEKETGRRRKRRRALAIALLVPLVGAALSLAHPRARTALRLVRGFSPLEADPRIHFEAGAEESARAFAAFLPSAVARVEELQAGAFEAPFRVYVCATLESFAGRIGEPADTPTRGIAFHRDVWMSPRAFWFHGEDTHRESLLHELSHLHLGQKLGWWRRVSGVPSWFQEGLANWVADTGDEQVTRGEARGALLRGPRLEPDPTGHLPLPRRPESYGLTWPMFHLQARMFVEYLEFRDERAFRNFVGAVVSGEPFERAFHTAYRATLSEVWTGFLDAVAEDGGPQGDAIPFPGSRETDP